MAEIALALVIYALALWSVGMAAGTLARLPMSRAMKCSGVVTYLIGGAICGLMAWITGRRT